MVEPDKGRDAPRGPSGSGDRGAPRAGGGVRVPGRAGPIVACIAIVAALSLGKDLLIPFALAGLFSFLLVPLSERLERLRIRRGLSAVVSVAILAGAIFAVLWIAASGAIDFSRRLPEYRQNIERKLAPLRDGSMGIPLFDEAAKAIDAPPPAAGATPAPGAAPEARPPQPVTIVDAPRSALRSFWSLLLMLSGPFGTFVVVVVLTSFLLTYRDDVRDLLIRLVSHGQIGLTTQAFDEAGRRVSRYLATALLVNALFGVVAGLGLAWIGVPSAALLGVLAGLLRFIPYVGAWIGAAVPFLVSFAVFDGWGRALAVVALFLGADLVVGNVVEPHVYGKRTGLSPLAVVVALVFWTWLWGVAGLLLAVPMTLCLAVAGLYVPGLEFLDVLLRDRPALGPADRAYQRLVALDADGARKAVEDLLSVRTPEEAADDVLLASLRRAETDRLRGALDADRLQCVCDGVVEAAEALGVPAAAAPSGGRGVLLLPAGDATDRAACEVLARRLAVLGVAAEVGPTGALSGEVAERVAVDQPAVALVSAVPPFASARVRYLVKRIKGRTSVPVVAAVWDPSADRDRLAASFSEAGADRTVVTLADAVREVRALLGERARGSPPAASP